MVVSFELLPLPVPLPVAVAVLLPLLVKDCDCCCPCVAVPPCAVFLLVLALLPLLDTLPPVAWEVLVLFALDELVLLDGVVVGGVTGGVAGTQINAMPSTTS